MWLGLLGLGDGDGHGVGLEDGLRLGRLGVGVVIVLDFNNFGKC